MANEQQGSGRIEVDRADLERFLRYFRSYWLLRDADGKHLPADQRRLLMDDESIGFAADEFIVANRKAP